MFLLSLKTQNLSQLSKHKDKGIQARFTYEFAIENAVSAEYLDTYLQFFSTTLSVHRHLVEEFFELSKANLSHHCRKPQTIRTYMRADDRGHIDHQNIPRHGLTSALHEFVQESTGAGFGVGV